MDIKSDTKKAIEAVSEEIHQNSEGSCPFCFQEDFPVRGNKKGYDEVLPGDAEEWQLEHSPDCIVSDLEKAHSKCI